VRAVADQGYTEPTPVQARAIPIILSGRDLLAGAQTGTGKTAAFVLPMLDGLHARRQSGFRKVRALVVVPTRELALQVEQSVRTYGGRSPIRSVAIYGGVRMDRQVRSLRKWPEIIVATPGRLLDHVRQGTVDLSATEVLVLDEGDRMLDMGFIHDIKRILEQLPAERQTLLFSATFSSSIRRLAADLLRNPESVDVAPRNATPTPIRQLAHPVDKARKRHLLAHMVRDEDMGQVLVFTRTKHGANRLAEQLGKDGIRATAIHGNKSQSQRVRALTAFKKGEAQVLVATDVAARGLDIDALPHVVNFELPTVPEDYVHRIGRTGRAGQEGTAISLVSGDERELMSGIEKLLKRSIEHRVVEGFEPSLAYRAEPIVTTRPAHGRSRPGNAPRANRDRSRGSHAVANDGWVGRRPSGGQGPREDRVGQPRRQGRPVRGQAPTREHGPVDRDGVGQGQAMPGERLSGRGSQAAGRQDGEASRGRAQSGWRRNGKRGRPRP
jgi:ATP-dependent RNA helicase RhlE